MRRLLPLLLVPALITFRPAGAPVIGSGSGSGAAQEATYVGGLFFDSYGREIFFAVLEGLYADGVDTEVLQSILRTDADGKVEHFVWSCPICMPAYEAMRLYAARPDFACLKTGGDTFGTGLPEETRHSLLHGNIKERQETIDRLVKDWVTRRLEKLRLSSEERDAWSQTLAERRKLGMTMLQKTPTGLQSCPFCDGAAGACPIR